MSKSRPYTITALFCGWIISVSAAFLLGYITNFMLAIIGAFVSYTIIATANRIHILKYRALTVMLLMLSCSILFSSIEREAMYRNSQNKYVPPYKQSLNIIAGSLSSFAGSFTALFVAYCQKTRTSRVGGRDVESKNTEQR